MTLRKFAVDYSKIKNDGPKVRAPDSNAVGYSRNFVHERNIKNAIECAARSLEQEEIGFGIWNTIMLTRKVAALYHVHNAVELIRKLKKEKSQSGSTVKTPTVNWFRGYYAHFGLRMRCNATTKYYVELHLGAQGWQTWQMLLGLGYTPDQDAFWLELDGFICAQSMTVATMDSVDGDLFMGAV